MNEILIINGIISTKSGQSVSNLIVKAFIYDSRCYLKTILLGQAITNEFGEYKICFADNYYYKKCNQHIKNKVIIQVYDKDNKVLYGESQLYELNNENLTIDLEVNIPGVNYIVEGKITDKNDNKLEGVTVRAFDKELRVENSLGNDTTDNLGNYYICYTSNELIYPALNTPNILVRVYSDKGTLYGESPVYFKANKHQIIDLKIDVISEPILSEYENLINTITPYLYGASLTDLSDEDIKFLSNRIPIDEDVLKVLTNCSNLSNETDIEAEVFYAFYKENLPLVINELIKLDNELIKEKLTHAVNSNFVSKKILDLIDDVINKLNLLKESKENEVINNSIAYSLTSQLISQASRPLIFYKVTIIDLSIEGIETVLGNEITNDLGLFSINYLELPKARDSEEPVQRTFKFVIRNEKDENIDERIITFNEGTEEVLIMTVTITETSQTETPKISDLNTTLDLGIPEEFLSLLEESNIKSLDDIRKTGGIESEDENMAQYVKLLNSHAALYSISTDIGLNQQLIENGFNNPLDIAKLPRSTFINSNIDNGRRDFINVFGLSTLNLKAKLLEKSLQDAISKLSIRTANGEELENWEEEALSNVINSPKCTCEDCESAISPLAYLVDLIEYTLKHVQIDNNQMTLLDIEKAFLQQISAIPNSCEMLDKQVKQIRICVEVLRRYIRPIKISESNKEINNKSFQKAEYDYLFEAYKELLLKLGTSYDELRLLRFEENKDLLNSLSDKIQIDVTKEIYVNDVKTRILDILFLTFEELTESNLETIFGLRDTRRDSFTNEDESYVLSWKIDYLKELWKKQDWIKNIEVPIIDPNVIDENDIRTYYRAQESCDSINEIKNEKEDKQLIEIRNDIGENPCEENIYCANVKYLLDKRKAYINNIIKELHDLNTVENQQVSDLKIIDMLDKTKVYIQQQMVENDFIELNIESLIDLYYKLKGISNTIKDPKVIAKQSIEAKDMLIKQKFSLQGFTRLVEILINRYNVTTERYEVSEGELLDICKILVNLIKMYAKEKWINEERDYNIQLSYEQFCISDVKLTEENRIKWEKANKYLASETARQEWQDLLRSNNILPIIEPDLLKNEYHLKTPILGDKAFTLLNNRQLWINNKLNELNELKAQYEVENNPIKVFDELLCYAVGINSNKLEEIINKKKYGESIKDTLEKYNLTARGINYIENIFNRALLNKTIDEFKALRQEIIDIGGDINTILIGYNNISQEEWDNIFSILVQVIKVRKYYSWRIEEKAEEITLSTEYFIIPEEVDNSIDSPQFDIPVWRSEYRDLKEWLNKLEARITRLDTIREVWNNQISVVEGNVLPMLREALIMESNAKGNTLEEKSKWLSNLLLIDTQQGSCLTTTRASQAIETLQSFLTLLFRVELRTEYPNVKLVSDSFEEDWKWLGSYSTWRAALFVYLYPENLLMPTIRTSQSPVFNDIVKSIRDNNKLTPEFACEQAKRYEEYLRDVSNLEILAICETDAKVQSGECRDRAASREESTIFMFARGEYTKKIYYSTYTPNSIEKEKKFILWKEVDNLVDNGNYNSNTPHVYAQPYILNDDEKYICLFAKLPTKDGNKLYLTKLNLRINPFQWETAIELNMPPESDIKDFNFVVQQSDDYSKPPYVAIQVYPSRTIYGASIDRDGKGFDGPDKFELLVARENNGNYDICGLVDFQVVLTDERGKCLIGIQKNSLGYKIVGNGIDSYWSIITSNYTETYEYVGAYGLGLGQATNLNPIDNIQVYYRVKSKNEKPVSTIGKRIEITNNKADREISSYEFIDWFKSISKIDLSFYSVTGEVVIPPKEIGNHSFTKPRYERKTVSLLNYLLGDKEFNSEVHFVRNGIGVDNSIITTIDKLVKVYTVDKLTSKEVFEKFREFKKVLVLYRKDNIINSNSISKDISKLYAVGKDISILGEQRRYLIYSKDSESSNVKNNYLGYDFNAFKINEVKLISLKYPGPLEIQEIVSKDENEKRRSKIQKAFIENQSSIKADLICLQEAYYHVPMYLALQLQRRGQYQSALNWFRLIYDYTAEISQRKIYYPLIEEGNINSNYKRDTEEWLSDPVNPHYIAINRRNCYTRYTIMSIVKCLLDYADAEFTKDTIESVANARSLYNSTLELLNAPEIKNSTIKCSDIIDTLDNVITSNNSALIRVKRKLYEIKIIKILKEATEEIKFIFGNNNNIEEAVFEAYSLIDEEKLRENTADSINQIIDNNYERNSVMANKLLARDDIFNNIQTVNENVVNRYANSISQVTGIDVNKIINENVDLPWLSVNKAPVPLWDGIQIKPNYISIITRTDENPDNGSEFVDIGYDPLYPTEFGVERAINYAAPIQAVYGNDIVGKIQSWAPKAGYTFCMPTNPIIEALYIHATQNLKKIRTCRNISGLQRQLEPYSAATDTFTGMPLIIGGQLVLPTQNILVPTPYRYSVLIERAKQLVNLASSIEASYLSALEKKDVEYYNLLKAKQDLSLSKAGIKLKQLQVNESKDNVSLSELQQERVKIQEDYYQGLIDEGWLDEEKWSEKLLIASAVSYGLAALAVLKPGVDWFGVGGKIASSLSYAAQAASTTAQILSMQANMKRMQQEWEFNKKLASQDLRISSQQIKISLDRVDITEEELKISELQSDFAEAIVDYLSNKKFNNAELYEWMSNVLEGVYRYFLIQATAVAKLAQLQLSFERQEATPQFIQADYWDALIGMEDSTTVDRRGLTGSARLLQDIYQLDQFAFDTAKKKLFVSKVISLSNLDPIAFQQFRETGVLRFTTPMEIFNRDFPSHYLRLIKKVGVNVLALVPAIQGIKATLSTTGLSTVIIGGDIFQEKKVKTTPESIALSAPNSVTGQYEMQYQQDMLLPFENLGVDTQWEFRMPKTANFIDYNSIADILFTIEYTALSDNDYGDKIIKELGTDVNLSRVFSFRQEFADQWYDLNNSDFFDSAEQMIVNFRTEEYNFPANMQVKIIDSASLYFVNTTGMVFEIDNVNLEYKSDVGKEASGTITTSNRLTGNLAPWNSQFAAENIEVVGTWTLNLKESKSTISLETTKALIEKGDIEDIIFILTFKGETMGY